jgi:tetratricopeptide (TPR) repeat protein
MKHYLILLACLLVSGTVLAADSMQQLIGQKEYAKAVQTGEQLLRENPNQPSIRFLTAYAHQMTGNTELSIKLYEDLIRDEPGLPEPRNNLAMIYLEKGDYDHASQLLVSAINTRISYATAYANLSQVYKGIASEAYRRAVSQSSEPAKYSHDIELTAITRLGAPDELPQLASLSAVTSSEAEPTRVDVANQETLLIEKVRIWSSAWSNKDFKNYMESYMPDYRSDFATHSQWVAYRRGRILRPGNIEVEVSNFAIKRRSDSRVSIDFTQAFSSPRYSDKVIKRLDFERVGSQWKIASERVLSVL